MSEPVQLAKQAREQLSLALNALQTNANVPDDLMAIADPIAEAMSVLHRVERSKGANLEGRDSALKSVRAALEGLQKITVEHPATEIVMEHVALSLAKVHALSRYQAPRSPDHEAARRVLEAGPVFAQPNPQPPAAQPVPQTVLAAPVPEQRPVVQPSPVVAVQPAPQPAPYMQQPAPQAPQPAPYTQQPAPYVQQQPAPQPAYAQQQPAPQPAYAQQQPAPQPAYAQQQPAPQPAYAQQQPAPQPAYAQQRPAQQPAPYAQQPAPQAPQPAPYAQQQPTPYAAPQPAPQQAAYAQPPAPYAQPPAPYAQQQPLPANPVPAQRPQPAPQQSGPSAQPNPYAPAAAPPEPQAAPAPQKPYAAPRGGAPAPTGKVLDVELGTHSASNFYKGLGGNDVIEHGGIFVATYKVPKIGSTVTLRMLLPGDLEFQANAVVQWSREGGTAGESAEPGFGARFTQITAEGRQLVYRYTRNREPIFYDDL